MKKFTLKNDRYPHTCKITRLVVSDNPFDDTEDETVVLYEGVCRSYTDTTVGGDKNMDKSRRKSVVPVRFDEWSQPIQVGDIIEATIGNYSESGIVQDFEPDNQRAVVYWEFGKVLMGD